MKLKSLIHIILIAFLLMPFPVFAKEWAKTYGGGEQYATSIKQTIDGSYVVAGETWSYGAGNSDFWILKLDLKPIREAIRCNLHILDTVKSEKIAEGMCRKCSKAY